MKRLNSFIFYIFVFSFLSCILCQCKSDKLWLSHIEISNHTTKKMCQIENEFLNRYQNAFLYLSSKRGGYVWSYISQATDTNVLKVAYIRDGEVARTYNFPYRKSISWIQDYNKRDSAALFVAEELDPNELRFSTLNKKRKERYPINMSPYTIFSLGDSIEVPVSWYYPSKRENENSSKDKLTECDTCSLMLPIGSFFSNMRDDLREYFYKYIFID